MQYLVHCEHLRYLHLSLLQVGRGSAKILSGIGEILLNPAGINMVHRKGLDLATEFPWMKPNLLLTRYLSLQFCNCGNMAIHFDPSLPVYNHINLKNILN